MQRFIYLTLTVLLVLAFTSVSQIPQTMSYQGVLTDNNGAVVSDGDYAMTFNLYNVETSGTALWSESQTVTVTNGIFNVSLGSITPLGLPFNQAYWLGITIASGSELTPRIELTSSAYSFRSASVEDSSITSNSVANGQVVRSINTLKDDIILKGGDNISVSQNGDSLIISATGVASGDITSVAAGMGLEGGGTSGDVTLWVLGGSGISVGDSVRLDLTFTDNRYVEEGQSNAITSAMLQDDIISSIDGVSNDAGNIDLIEGSNITITPDNANNQITISASASNLWDQNGSNIYYNAGNVGIGTSSPAYPLSIFPGTNTVGLLIDHNQTGSNSTFGISVDLDRTGSGNADIYGIRSYATSNNSLWSTRGLMANADGNSAGPKYGVYAVAAGSGSLYGVKGVANSATGSSQYGLWGEAIGSGTGVHYGVYGTTSGGGSNHWAGYFNGNTYVDGNLGVGTQYPSTALEVADTIYSSVGGFKFPDGTVQQTAAGATSINDLSDAVSGGNSVFLGAGAGNNDDFSDNRNTGVGINALRINNTGSINTAVGYNTLYSNTSGTNNTAIGYQALYLNGSASFNTAVGYNALNANTSGTANTALGTNALLDNRAGDSNVGIGHEANFLNQDGSRNTIIGTSAGRGATIHTKSGNVFLGYQAGYNETGNEKLYIENSDISTPLIYGEFDNDILSVNGDLGVKTSNPSADIHVVCTDGALFTGTFGSGSIPIQNAGTRMMWYPAKAAFRAGMAGYDQWNDANIGDYSVAMGNSTTASGIRSVAFGLSTLASGQTSTAMGSNTSAIGNLSTAMGSSTSAEGTASIAMGSNSSAVGGSSVAIGTQVTAGGSYSTAMGNYIATTGTGSFAIGDLSTTSVPTFTTNNRFYARFASGYRLYTSADLSSGAQLTAGANSWSTISDSTKKENFKSVNGEEVLNKIKTFKLTSWNYIGQDPQKFRHYGPMAQEFFAAFGNDGIGTVGNDTTLSSADFDGINLIAIQALEKRTSQLQDKVQKIETLQNELLAAQNENSELKHKIAAIESKYQKIELILSNLLKTKNLKSTELTLSTSK